MYTKCKKQTNIWLDKRQKLYQRITPPLLQKNYDFKCRCPFIPKVITLYMYTCIHYDNKFNIENKKCTLFSLLPEFLKINLCYIKNLDTLYFLQKNKAFILSFQIFLFRLTFGSSEKLVLSKHLMVLELNHSYLVFVGVLYDDHLAFHSKE